MTTLVYIQDQERLQNFITWAITTALASESSQRLRSNESRIIVKKELGEESHDDSLVSKFLRWLTASVIIGKLCHQKSSDINSGFAEIHKLESLQSLLVHVENTSGQRHDFNIGSEDLLASTIFYLQPLPGINQLLPSVVSALCLLTFGTSNLSGSLLYSLYI